MGRIQNWMRPIAVHSELDNFLIIVVIWDGYSAVVAVLCVVDRRWHTMHDYMKALYQQVLPSFCRNAKSIPGQSGSSRIR